MSPENDINTMLFLMAGNILNSDLVELTLHCDKSVLSV